MPFHMGNFKLFYYNRLLLSRLTDVFCNFFASDVCSFVLCIPANFGTRPTNVGQSVNK
jgi:hypothetical protein